MNWTRFQLQSIDAASALARTGLADAGHVLDQQVAFGEEAHHRQLDRVVLAVQDLSDVRGDRIEQIGEAAHRRGVLGGFGRC